MSTVCKGVDNMPIDRVVKVTFSEKDFEELLELEGKTGKKKAELVREFYFKGKQLVGANEGIDLVTDIIDERLRAILKPQIERLAAISAKGAIMSATSTFLNAQALVDFVPVGKQKEFIEVYEKARIKGIAYVKGRSNDEYDIQEDIKKEYKE